jgi:LmbE family N-acetylglucosaminyl deacetylase
MAGVLDDAEISRILSITAHPDDVDFAAAGTVARWTEAGIEVVYCLVTDGDAGGFDEDFPREEIPAVRRVSASECTTCASSATRTAGWKPAWTCAATWPG